jgi:tRNA pseudouridine55 synthase
MDTGMHKESSGIVVVDKPPGMTSARVVAAVKRVSGAAKVGHAGTLDPFATGVLICLINHATRLARYLVDGWKTYEAEMRLGVETDTQDLTGREIATGPITEITDDAIHEAAGQFVGAIEQTPPVYSALKHRGRPLYDLARKGTPVQKPPRRILIDRLEVLHIRHPLVGFRVTCSAGTYVRTLAADIGSRLGCGAHLTALRRTASGGFTLDGARTLDEIKQEKWAMVSMTDALSGLPTLVADEALVADIRHGRPIAKTSAIADSAAPGHVIRVVDRNRRLLAVLEDREGNPVFDYGCVLIR